MKKKLSALGMYYVTAIVFVLAVLVVREIEDDTISAIIIVLASLPMLAYLGQQFISRRQRFSQILSNVVQFSHPMKEDVNLFYTIEIDDGQTVQYDRQMFYEHVLEAWHLQQFIQSGMSDEQYRYKRRYESVTSQRYWTKDRRAKLDRPMYKAFVALLSRAGHLLVSGKKTYLVGRPLDIVDRLDAIYKFNL